MIPMQEEIYTNLQKISTWKRVFYMLIYLILAGLVRMLIWGVVIIQLGTVIFTGGPNQHILGFGRSLSAYMYHLLLFLTFNTDEMAFPFASWALTQEPDFPNKVSIKK